MSMRNYVNLMLANISILKLSHSVTRILVRLTSSWPLLFACFVTKWDAWYAELCRDSRRVVMFATVLSLDIVSITPITEYNTCVAVMDGLGRDIYPKIEKKHRSTSLYFELTATPRKPFHGLPRQQSPTRSRTSIATNSGLHWGTCSGWKNWIVFNCSPLLRYGNQRRNLSHPIGLSHFQADNPYRNTEAGRLLFSILSMLMWDFADFRTIYDVNSGWSRIDRNTIPCIVQNGYLATSSWDRHPICVFLHTENRTSAYHRANAVVVIKRIIKNMILQSYPIRLSHVAKLSFQPTCSDARSIIPVLKITPATASRRLFYTIVNFPRSQDPNTITPPSWFRVAISA